MKHVQRGFFSIWERIQVAKKILRFSASTYQSSQSVLGKKPGPYMSNIRLFFYATAAAASRADLFFCIPCREETMHNSRARTTRIFLCDMCTKSMCIIFRCWSRPGFDTGHYLILAKKDVTKMYMLLSPVSVCFCLHLTRNKRCVANQ